MKPVIPHAGESKADFSKRKKKADELKLSDFEHSDSDEILSKSTIAEGIMLPRMQEIFGLVSDVLKEQGLLKDIPAGLVITGGGALTLQIAEVAKRELNLPARVGEPTKLDGLVKDIHSPVYANVIGLLYYGLNHGQADADGPNDIDSKGPMLDSNISKHRSFP